ncbi:molybdopterin-guanine dinucleotide biosynthesis protein B [Sutterella sp.]|uniref:molybdopterin-guanine dinucleotide biosynthesis protein B n=1 Tax=Sutterella sp. TaxID=1981025 RepID=UPI0026DEB312|nr:molybdopterin-guanine dinucleotide biosynthesis protein B [Sutterella sp.]MDO5531958.1 molybdopterin-guanine dinucleotide biosynthesis protein B [Sutterella sp.]
MTSETARPDGRRKPFCIGLLGRSGAGKTTLGSQVLAALTRRGLRVVALKDAHHGVDLDKPGKDTWRYREAGAERVILRTAERWTVMSETPEGPPPVEMLIALAGDADIVLIEGFKHEGDFPRIEIRRSAVSDAPPISTPDHPPAAFATDYRFEGFEGVPRLDVNDPEAVADFIEALSARRA